MQTETVRASAKGPLGQRRGRGARERILEASRSLFRAQGINKTGIDQLCKVANVSIRTAYQHFGSKDGIVAEYLRDWDPDTMASVFDRADLPPRERLLAAFETPQSVARAVTPLCPYLAAAVEITDPEHQARVWVREYKYSVAKRMTETAREAGAADPEVLGEQLALLLDGASARTRCLNADAFNTAAAIAATLIDAALPVETESTQVH